MPIPVTCPKCGLKSKALDEAVGRKVRCKCGEKILVVAEKSEESTRTKKPSRSSTTPSAPSAPHGTKTPQPAPPHPESKPAPNLLDLLSEGEQLQPQSNPYAVAEKTIGGDAEALKNYFREDGAKVAKAKQSQSNLLLTTVVFFLAAIRNMALAVIAMAFLEKIPDAKFVNPYMVVGGAYLAVLIVYALFDLAAGMGMVLRKPWGWWLAIFGLGWGIWERVASFVVVCLTNEDFVGPLIVGIASLVLCGVSGALIAALMSKDSRKRFGVEIKPVIAWLLVLLVPLLIEGGIAAGFYSAVKQASGEPADPSAS